MLSLKRYSGIGVILMTLIRRCLFLAFLYSNFCFAISFQARECALPEKTTADTADLAVCSRASAHANGMIISDKSLAFFHYERGYTSLHYRHLSFHLEGVNERGRDFPAKEIDYTLKTIESASLQLGDPGYNHFWWTIGRQRPPFGFNKNPFNDFTTFFDPRYFWEESRTAIRVSWDNQEKITIENEMACNDENNCKNRGFHDYTFTTRAMYDLAIFHGTRLELSTMAQAIGTRKLSLGILNINPKGNMFHIEMIRVRTTPDGVQDPYGQLFRIAYQDSMKKKSRALILYDDVRFQYRLFGIGTDYRATHWVHSKFALFYRKDETGKKRHRWFFNIGVDIQL
jgi:hypothetical protein